jgi:hypothetical protein
MPFAAPAALKAPVYFLHINKTAGTSFATVAQRAFPVERTCPAGLVPELLSLPAPRIKSYDYFHGHFGLGLLSLLPRGQAEALTIFTLLRDPVDRVISQINAHFRNPGTALHKAVVARRGDVTACLAEPAIAHMLADYQTRSLGLPLDFAALKIKGAPFRGLQELTAEAARGADPDALLAQAKQTLDRCAMIGLAERFDESVRWLARWLGVPHDGPAPRRNVSAFNPDTGRPHALSRADLSDATIRRLEEINRLDIALYEHARRLFEARRAA